MMKSAAPAFVLGCLLLGGASVAMATTPEIVVFPHLQNDPLFDRDTYQDVRDITVSVAWRQTDLRTALRDLSLLARTAYPNSAGIDFRFSSTVSPAERRLKINLTLRGAPIYQVLEYLSRQGDFTIKVHTNLVLLEPR